jgi:hypothetical protein
MRSSIGRDGRCREEARAPAGRTGVLAAGTIEGRSEIGAGRRDSSRRGGTSTSRSEAEAAGCGGGGTWPRIVTVRRAEVSFPGRAGALDMAMSSVLFLSAYGVEQAA